MCKKVAQLTRVIFYLNTKNDEYESNLKAVVNAYEIELDNTLKEVPPSHPGQYHHTKIQGSCRTSK
jgi:hypothetical protein